MIGAGFVCVDEVLEMERVALCGERDECLADCQALDAGHVASSLAPDGRRVGVQRPRVGTVEGHELRSPSWREWSAREPLDERAVEQMVLGVSAAATCVRQSHCRKRLRCGVSARARRALGSSTAPSANWPTDERRSAPAPGTAPAGLGERELSRRWLIYCL